MPYPDYDDYFRQFTPSSLSSVETPLLPFQTSRGCWWGEKHHCKFCGLNGGTMAFRSKSPERVLAEIHHLRDRYGIDTISVVDNILDMAYFDTLLPLLERKDDRGWRETIEKNQLAKMRERGSDLTIFSPRASFMAHHIGDYNVSATWSAICNELIHRVVQLFPDHFIGGAMLPHAPQFFTMPESEDKKNVERVRAVAADIGVFHACGSVRSITVPEAVRVLSTTWGCIITPLFATADAINAMCSGTTCTWPWPKPWMASSARESAKSAALPVIEVTAEAFTADDVFASIMALLPPDRVPEVVFMTLHAPRSWVPANNMRIKALPAKYSNVKVLDWDAAAATIQDQLSYADGGIHLATPVAKQFYANQIFDALGRPDLKK